MSPFRYLAVHGWRAPCLPPTLLFLSINQSVGRMTVGQSDARSDMALRLLSYESRAARRRLKNKEEVLIQEDGKESSHDDQNHIYLKSVLSVPASLFDL